MLEGKLDHRVNSFYDTALLADPEARQWAAVLLRLLLLPTKRADAAQDEEVQVSEDLLHLSAAEAEEEAGLRRRKDAQARTIAMAQELGCEREARLVKSGRLTVRAHWEIWNPFGSSEEIWNAFGSEGLGRGEGLDGAACAEKVPMLRGASIRYSNYDNCTEEVYCHVSRPQRSSD